LLAVSRQEDVPPYSLPFDFAQVKRRAEEAPERRVVDWRADPRERVAK